MKNISMLKFRRMCEDAAPIVYSFDFANQQESNLSENMEMTSVFTDMSMMFNPNRICFRNNSGAVCFNRVKSVNYYDESQAFGMVFGIICGNSLGDEQDVVYKIIVDKRY